MSPVDPTDLDDEKQEPAEVASDQSLPSPKHSVPSPHAQHTLRKLPWRLHVTDFSTILSAKYQGVGSEEDPYVVTWLDNDCENPQHYSLSFKCAVTFLTAFMTLCVSLASSAYTGAAKEIITQFDVSQEVYLIGLSLMVLGFAVGPLLWAPLSEAVGRRSVLLFGLIIYTMWTALCAAATNIQSLIVYRFLAGTSGSAAFVIPSGLIADLYAAEHRGVAISMFAAAPFLGPTIGPLIGGYLSPAAGWRWVMGFLALYAGILTALGILFVPETYGPVLLRTRAKKLSQVTGKTYMIQMDVPSRPRLTVVLKKSLLVPWKLLFREPIVFCLALYQAVVYGTLYLCFPAFPIVFGDQRGWNAGQTGLAFIGIAVGILVGVGLIVIDNQKRYVPLHRKYDGFAPPESRLPTVMVGGVFAVVGLAWFASTVGKTIPWPAPVFAGLPFGIGFILVFMGTMNYLVDAYVIYAASVSAAVGVLRSIFGAVFPLFATYMYHDLGVHWASAVPAFISLACLPFPIIFYRYGPSIRRKCKYSAEAALILDGMKSSLERQRSRPMEDASEMQDNDSVTASMDRDIC